jgi:tetrahydromethanopterin S-methyltransferase subunit F
MENENPQNQISENPLTSKIDGLDINEVWKQRFKLIEKIGWDKGMWKNYGNFKQLSTKERMQVGFNVWALLFGPFYYFAKGMWKMALIILGAWFLLIFALSILGIDFMLFRFLIPGWCCGMANYDYYQFKVGGKFGGNKKLNQNEKIAVGLIVAGVLLVGFFALIYDTTVAVPGQFAFQYDHIYNSGKMQNRWVGIVIGLVGAVVGTVMLQIQKKRD